MARIKITALTDKMKDEQVLSKLKSIGVKVKDKIKKKATKHTKRQKKSSLLPAKKS